MQGNRNKAGIEQNGLSAKEKCKGSPSHRVVVFIPEPVYQRLQRIAEERGFLNVSCLVLRACEFFLKNRWRGY